MAEFTDILSDADLSIYDDVYGQLKTYNLESLTDDVVRLVQLYGSDMKETIKAELRNTEAYKQRFAGNIARKAAGKSVLSEGEYIYNERLYEETMLAYNAGEFATRENFAKFIGGSVSPNEVAARFSTAYDRIKNADADVKNQLNKMYPGISDNDLVKSLLLGSEGSNYLKSRIGQAEILAETSKAGITLQTSAAELEAKGVSRETAAKGAGVIADMQSGLRSAATRFGQSTEGLQSELEQAAFGLRPESKRIKSLASQSRAEFQKSSGITSGSLKKNVKGQL
jgi:hypothetical protein